MAEKNIDELASLLYEADMRVAGDLLVVKWEYLDEPGVSRYRAMAQAAQSYHSTATITERLNAVETAIQLLTGNMLNFRTELLAVKSLCNEIAEHTGTDVEAEQERQDTQKYIEHYYEGGD